VIEAPKTAFFVTPERQENAAVATIRLEETDLAVGVPERYILFAEERHQLGVTVALKIG
jgi:hypothetical protein